MAAVAAFQLPTVLLGLSVMLGNTAAPEGLKRLELKNAGIEVFYDARRSSPIPTKPEWIKAYDEAGVYASVPLLLDFGTAIGKLAVGCDSGPSADPSCYLLRDAADPDTRVFESPGTRFTFLGDGRILVSGHTDNMYDHRRLYTWDGAKFVETAQPLRYVGVEAKAKVTIALHAAREANAPVSLTLAAGSAFTILLNDNAGVDEHGENADYLVRTAEGIVGWVHLPSRPDGSSDAEGLFFKGD